MNHQREACALRIVWLTGLLVWWLLAASAHAEPYPRVASYAKIRSGGYPLVRADGRLDSVLCRKLARHSIVTLHVSPVLERPDAALLLRHYNPKIRILGYQLLTSWWLKAGHAADPNDRRFFADWHRALQATGGFLPNVPDEYVVDWSQRDVADTLTTLLRRAASSRLFDGFFFDYCSPAIAWTRITTPEQDAVRVAHMRTLAWRSRDAGGCGFVVVGNGTGAELLSLDGTMREGYYNGLTTFGDLAAWQAAPLNWLKTEGWWAGAYSLDACRRVRLALGSACVVGAFGSFGDGDPSPTDPYHAWWYDEYAVTPVNGAWGGITDTAGRWVGWLGEAVAPAVTLASGVVRRDFPNGLVLVNPTSAAVTVDLIYPAWRRIRGRRDPWTNNGRADRYQTIPARDALFMVRNR
jgi:hypothetical protein